MSDTGPDIGSEAVQGAADRLYAVPVDDFMALRSDLSTQLREAGDAAGAKAVTALRKPTVGASYVNRLVLDDPGRVERLVELGNRLRAAQDELDATALRELSTQRRSLVGELARDAFALADRRDPPAALRDEVTQTLDAAIADQQIAAELGRLTRAQQWSGFGVAPAAPGLTLLPGGRAGSSTRSGRTGSQASRDRTPAAKKDAPAASEPRAERSAQRKATRTLERARESFAGAEDTLAAAEADEQAAGERVHELEEQARRLQRELDDAKSTLQERKRAAKSARSRRREAQAALDRAERTAAR